VWSPFEATARTSSPAAIRDPSITFDFSTRPTAAALQDIRAGGDHSRLLRSLPAHQGTAERAAGPRQVVDQFNHHALLEFPADDGVEHREGLRPQDRDVVQEVVDQS
jgi:hypothetical protein